VVFGSVAGFPASLDLAALDGTDGFRLDGDANQDRSGMSVSDAGDVNGDGIDDLIIGAPNASTASGQRSGASYVVFGTVRGSRRALTSPRSTALMASASMVPLPVSTAAGPSPPPAMSTAMVSTM
jgi:hypothetical protein